MTFYEWSLSKDKEETMWTKERRHFTLTTRGLKRERKLGMMRLAWLAGARSYRSLGTGCLAKGIAAFYLISDCVRIEDSEQVIMVHVDFCSRMPTLIPKVENECLGSRRLIWANLTGPGQCRRMPEGRLVVLMGKF